MNPAAELYAQEMAHRGRELVAAYAGAVLVFTSVVGHTAVKVAEDFMSPDYTQWLQTNDAYFLLVFGAGLAAAGICRYQYWRASQAHAALARLTGETQPLPPVS